MRCKPSPFPKLKSASGNCLPIGSLSFLILYPTLAERHLALESFQTMLASEPVLRRDWERPEEDAAWKDL